MNIFVYSDESGVFDKVHNKKFVFGGLIFIDKTQKEICERKYKKAEEVIYKSGTVCKGNEIKASKITNSQKTKLFRSLNNQYKFGIIINQSHVLDRIYESKKDKQRYLDFAYKIGIKNALKEMIHKKIINPDDVENIYFFVDEHTTATNGRYELKEGLEQELKRGTFNQEFNKFFEPLFPHSKIIDLRFCNSESVTLIRAADIISNKIYFISLNGNNFSSEINKHSMFITKLP